MNQKMEINRRPFLNRVVSSAISLMIYCSVSASAAGSPKPTNLNIIFILTDDHRYDAMSFVGHPFLKTPSLDSLAQSGVYFPNAFVTSSLCSPSRASILTGLYMHNHHVIDNLTRVKPKDPVFPQRLQETGYRTAFIGKWHMGEAYDEPRPGFDHWVSFRGQGSYFPKKGDDLNINGQRVPQKGYITDELTDYAIEWLDSSDPNKPFFLYFSHKGVHGPYIPAPRHQGKYKDVEFKLPETMDNTPENYSGKPMWVKNQRNSWHGVEFPYHSKRNIEELYKNYCEMILSVDESVGRVMTWVRQKGLEDNTLIIYMGDNGHLWGEHGLIDKRCGYEESIRVPLIASCPALFKPGTTVDSIVANIDIAPTILEAAGIKAQAKMDGKSFLGLAKGETDSNSWRDYLLYEYYWEWVFPQTPTNFVLRGKKYKLIQYYGIWDIDELYDIENDPKETKNLIFDPKYQSIVKEMRESLYQELKRTGGLSMPLGYKQNGGLNLRRADGSKPSDFPLQLIHDGQGLTD